MTPPFIASAASVALLGAGFFAADGTRSAEALPMGSTSLEQGSATGGGSCRIDLFRTAPAGAAAITRHVLADGTCVCTITTGPEGSNGDAESIVTNLFRDRTCDGAPAPRVDGVKQSGFVGPAAILPAVASATAGSLALASGNDSAG